MMYLMEMTKSNNGKLLYRATRDGFSSQSFHSNCDGKANTIAIIKNNLNYVFGGYASTAWASSGSYASDNALQMNPSFGPIFGRCDIIVANNSNVVADTITNFGYYYNLPEGYTQFSENTMYYLAGKKGYLTVEIEVYEIN